jgi:3-hydroxyisobutyrate dehydrogenase-like beta-hydroxyacid dehydrogenase
MPALLGFVGLGVMGEPMCRNLARKSGAPVAALDLDPEPVRRLAADGVRAADSLASLARAADVVFLSLPGGTEVAAVSGELLPHLRAGACLVDLSTAPVKLARDLAAACAARGVEFADAPVARTREAAVQGTLSIMVGAPAPTFQRIRPLLACMGSDVSHCGGPGAGQLAKLMNNMVLVQNVVALAEALAVARASGVDAAVLFEVLAKGSADSFALRNHGMKALLPGAFPERAFSAEYMLKDVGYALELAAECGLSLSGAENARELLQKTIAAGFGAEYFPALAKVIGKRRP